MPSTPGGGSLGMETDTFCVREVKRCDDGMSSKCSDFAPTFRIIIEKILFINGTAGRERGRYLRAGWPMALQRQSFRLAKAAFLACQRTAFASRKDFRCGVEGPLLRNGGASAAGKGRLPCATPLERKAVVSLLLRVVLSKVIYIIRCKCRLKTFFATFFKKHLEVH